MGWIWVEQARLSPRAVDDRGRELRARIDQDGEAPADDQWVRPRNELRYRVRANGRVTGSFDLETEAGALFQSVLSPLAKPEPMVEGLPDDRTVAERQGDGFTDLIRLAAVADDLPVEGGAKPHVAVTVPLEVLEQWVGTALLEGAGCISARRLGTWRVTRKCSRWCWAAGPFQWMSRWPGTRCRRGCGGRW